MQVCISLRSQRLAHDEQEEVRAELRATLTEGGVTEGHAEKMAQALGEATGKGQRVSDQADDDLPGENLAPWSLCRSKSRVSSPDSSQFNKLRMRLTRSKD
jgi:hypothetical protein